MVLMSPDWFAGDEARNLLAYSLSVSMASKSGFMGLCTSSMGVLVLFNPLIQTVPSFLLTNSNWWLTISSNMTWPVEFFNPTRGLSTMIQFPEFMVSQKSIDEAGNNLWNSPGVQAPAASTKFEQDTRPPGDSQMCSNFPSSLRSTPVMVVWLCISMPSFRHSWKSHWPSPIGFLE